MVLATSLLSLVHNLKTPFIKDTDQRKAKYEKLSTLKMWFPLTFKKRHAENTI